MIQAFRSAFGLILLVVARTAIGQVTPDTTIELPEATVTGSRGQGDAVQAVSRLTVLPIDRFERESFRTLADLLDASTGIYIRRAGGSGSAGISLRGTDPSQTEILLDGLRITDPQSGQVDLSLIPVILLQSIEIVHGSAGSTQGSGGLGGTVRLHTLQPNANEHAAVRAETGAYGARSLSAMATGGGESISVLAAAQRIEDDGNFPYWNTSLQPPEKNLREGAETDGTSLFTKLTVHNEKHRASLSGWYNRLERGLPGPGNAPPVPSVQTDESFRSWLGSSHSLSGVRLTTDWSVQRSRLRYVNQATATNDLTTTTTLDGKVGATAAITNRSVVQAGINWSEDKASGVDEHRFAASTSTTTQRGPVTLEASLRGDVWFAETGTRSQIIPRAGVNVKEFLHTGLTFKAGAGRTWTVPSLVDRFWVPGGNPNLLPEHGWTGDAGVVLHGDRGMVELTGFATSLSDRIVWNPSLVGAGVRVWRPTNVGRVVSYGFEGSAATEFGVFGAGGLTTGLTITYTEALDRSDVSAASYGHQLRDTPRLVATSHATLRLSRLRLGCTGQLVGRRYVTSDESSALPSYLVLAARGSYEVDLGPVNATLTASAENITNKTYSTVRLYPMPPRHFRVGVTIDWRRSS